MNTHVERARQIADALESQDVEQTLHEQFVAEWKAWEAEQREGGREPSYREFDREIGRGKDYTGRIVRFVTGAAPERSNPFADGGNVARTERANARKVADEQPEALAPTFAENPDALARLLNAVDDEREKTETPPAPRPDRSAGQKLERGWERVYYSAKDQLARMQDVAPDDSDHLNRVLSNIEDVVRLAKRALNDDDFAQVEEWLSNAS